MTGTNTNSASKRLAVVTGANKGIGLEICRQLASNGVAVVLTARDENRGVEAVEKLKGSGLSDVVFHQLEVTDPASIASLALFIKTQFGKLDILVNNAGVNGAIFDDAGLAAIMAVGDSQEVRAAKFRQLVRQTCETGPECLQVNYYGTKKVTEALLPLLQLSDSPRIVNVSSSQGKLQNISVTWAKDVLSDTDGLTEERVDEAVNKYLKEFKEGLIETKGGPAYCMSKAVLNAYTRILSKKFPKFRINCVCPGYVKSDFNLNTGKFTIEEGAAGPVKLALLPDDGPSGLFFFQKEVTSFD
ncbi:(+)-neomenthol dehydrogenase-like [Macadamia integrifolia]|uniref:(+)-neomenthol dehydrogenase-like n=1 Tax=Macadamia integrifolia TaxID=60698 RepID=UPI001C4EFE3E|nr:(+)-neomenthol dehydrogenase-like [Macadamia integrifolia]XP_042485339.1 (+)-neomenthol dehydrogenase-like [Macadamia integrifolia]XP_042485926.1 (+)-neomenthol dehydrogenase-like [Macadamia integrifolia]XP_042486326.1 (+)-neomenthol dehydrogenase-like [Macadamia integrifolia]XP_042505101.1 (+)-neomenthol dehydrogenase-like [Macadamia integrifolia]XP_042505220.1 (+)-neomenthol dehydrogenase-like [Macadamia integrifolia]XP_042514515.1 (+)-neomenthol dehydrogenase-like [Macadamia integrifoli